MFLMISPVLLAILKDDATIRRTKGVDMASSHDSQMLAKSRFTEKQPVRLQLIDEATIRNVSNRYIDV